MNPQQMINNLIQQNPNIKNNPIMQNAFQMAQKGDERGLQQLAQNVAQAKGVDLNKFIQQIKSQFNI